MKEIWDQRFSADEYYYGKAPNPFFRESIDKLVPGTLLMPAEGEGRNAVYAASSGWKVKAIDFSVEGRKKTLKLAEENRVTVDYDLGDITSLDFGENKYDAVGLIYAHMDPEHRAEVHRRLVRSLKPGGTVILEGFNKRQLGRQSGGPRTAELLYEKKMLAGDFKECDIIELEEYLIHLDAGNGHKGESEIIRLIARKKDIKA